MKKYLLSFAFILCVSMSVVFAQGKSAEERAEQQTKNLTKIVGLNADQAKKIYDINLSIDKQADEVRKGEKGKKGGYGGKIAKLNKDRESQTVAVFTPEQKAKYDQWKEKRKERREEKGKGKGKKIDNDDND